MIIALYNRAMSVILCEGDVFVGQCRHLSKCVDESLQKARGIVEMGVCWPAFGGERMIGMHLLEFEREFGCLRLVFDSVCAFVHEVRWRSTHSLGMCAFVRGCMCVCVTQFSLGKGSGEVVPSFSVTNSAPRELNNPFVLLQPHSIFPKPSMFSNMQSRLETIVYI